MAMPRSPVPMPRAASAPRARRAHARVILVLAASLFLAPGVAAPSAGEPAPGGAATASGAVGALREEARLAWRARGEAEWAARGSGASPAPRAADPLLSTATIARVREAAAGAADREEKRRLRLLELHLVAESAAARGADAGARITELGYEDYVTFSQAFRGVFLPPLMRDAMALVRQSAPLYDALLAESARATIGKSPVSLVLNDIERIEASPDLYRFFPAELVVPAFRDYLAGLGLEFTDLNGKPIMSDTVGQEPLAFPVEIPADVRFSAPPAGGLAAFRNYFREAGRALAMARTTAPEWEYRHLGSTATREGLARLCESAWSDSAWLARYQALLAAQPGHGPVPSAADLRAITRRSLLFDLLAFRRDVQARLIAECIRHRAPTEYVIPYFTESGDDPKATWRTLLGFALGLEIPPADTPDPATVLTPFFLTADRAQGWALAATLDQGLRARFGPAWRRAPAAGVHLTSALMAPGTRLTVLDAARTLDITTFNYDPLFDRFCRVGEWTPTGATPVAPK